jgi:hypothetical protein
MLRLGLQGPVVVVMTQVKFHPTLDQQAASRADHGVTGLEPVDPVAPKLFVPAAVSALNGSPHQRIALHE